MSASPVFADDTGVSKHAGASASQSGSSEDNKTRPQGSDKTKDPDKEARKKAINEAADSDWALPEGRTKLQSVANDIWKGLPDSQQKELEDSLAKGETDKLDSLLKEQGLVLSSPEKKQQFLQNFSEQVRANSKLKTSQGINELSQLASSDAKGNPLLQKKILTAKEALKAAIKEQQPVIDYLTKNFGWKPESTLRTLKAVEEQMGLLQTGTKAQRAAAVQYLYQVFTPIYSSSLQRDGQPSRAVNDLFQNPKINSTEFGKAARTFFTAGLGQNFSSEENPKGACAGVECARDFVASALTRSALSPKEGTVAEAQSEYNRSKGLPSHIKRADGSRVPTISDEGIRALADTMAAPENSWLYDAKEKYRQKKGLNTIEDVERRVSLNTQEQLEALFTKDAVKENNGATLFVTRKTQAIPSNGDAQTRDSKHVVTVSRIGLGANQMLVVRDPNRKGLGFDVKVDPLDRDGRFSYSYIGPDGSKQTVKWENFFPGPDFWPE